MGSKLNELHCKPIGRGSGVLLGAEITALLAQLDPAWRVRSGPELARVFVSSDYPLLVDLAAKIGALAQAEDHHPELRLAWGRLEISVSTHSIGALSMNDFVLAAWIDGIARGAGL